MADASTIVPAAGLGGIASYLIQTGFSWYRQREERAEKKEKTEASIEEHRDNLTFALLKASREEVAAARAEMADYRAIQLRLLHFEESLDHIEALLTASSPEEKAAAEKRGRQFLTRMKRSSDGMGALKQEVQILGDKLVVQPPETALDRSTGVGDALKQAYGNEGTGNAAE